MVTVELVGIYTTTDRRRIAAVNDTLLACGIKTVLIPSARYLQAWDVEVPAEDATAARAIIERA